MPLRSCSKMLNSGTLPAETFWKADSLENREAHASHIRPPPGAEMAVKAAKRRASGRSAAESLDGHRSGG
jgi:hypothetical protein